MNAGLFELFWAITAPPGEVVILTVPEPRSRHGLDVVTIAEACAGNVVSTAWPMPRFAGG